MHNFRDSDTIAALATPPGVGALAIVRVSGEGTTAILTKLIGEIPAPRYAKYTCVQDSESIIDEGVVVYYEAPASYTGEDMSEITVHGGPAVAAKTLQAVLQAGARPAEPGEFTYRALINGKLDMVQARAVADMASAETEYARRDALARLNGQLSARFATLRELALALVTDIESDINFGIELDTIQFIQGLEKLREVCSELLENSPPRRLATTGIKILIAGPRNAGKSTLFNRLIGDNRAIVTSIPGTTTDRIEAKVVWDGHPYIISDSAGLSDIPRDEVEAEGIKRSREFLKQCDIVISVEDGTNIEHTISSNLSNKNTPVISVLNKADDPAFVPKIEYLSISAANGDGILTLINQIRANMPNPPEDVISLAVFEQEGLRNAISYLEKATKMMDEGYLDQVAQELRYVSDAVGRLLGEIKDEELLGKIFANFCVGK